MGSREPPPTGSGILGILLWPVAKYSNYVVWMMWRTFSCVLALSAVHPAPAADEPIRRRSRGDAACFQAVLLMRGSSTDCVYLV